MSKYPTSGSNQWGNLGYDSQNQLPQNQSKPQYNSYGYDAPNIPNVQNNNNSGWPQQNINSNNSGWQQNQNQNNNTNNFGYQTTNNNNNNNQNTTGWGKPYQTTNSYGYGQIKSNTTLWDESAKVNFGMDKLSVAGSQLNLKQYGLDNIAKLVDWDQVLRQKNFTKQRNDTTWVTYQEQSWKKPQHSNQVQKQVQRKFAFPNPYIKYKIIPGVDQKKALDITSKDQLDKGLVKGNLIIWDYHGGPNQQFYIQRVPSPNNSQNVQQDQFLLINASTGFCVSTISQTIKSSKKSNQNKLCVYPKLDKEVSQRWRLKRFQNTSNIFLIGWAGNNGQTVLDCQNQSSSNGTNVLQWKANGGKNQLWKILPA